MQNHVRCLSKHLGNRSAQWDVLQRGGACFWLCYVNFGFRAVPDASSRTRTRTSAGTDTPFMLCGGAHQLQSEEGTLQAFSVLLTARA